MNSNDVRRQWAERSGAYSPEYYAYYGPNETSELLRTTLGRFVDSDATILELGCSSGRHLSHLYEHGFENVHGIEINDEALDVMADTYPELATRGTFYIDAIEDIVTTFDDGAFDVVYSVETLQHLHPDDEWVFEELTRITEDLLVTAENEGVNDGELSCEDANDGKTNDKGLNDGEANAGRERDDRTSNEYGRTYVDDDFPLYYRNWNEIFTELGMVEIDVREGRRETVRVFRPARD